MTNEYQNWKSCKGCEYFNKKFGCCEPSSIEYDGDWVEPVDGCSYGE